MRFTNDAGQQFDDLAGWRRHAPPVREHHWAEGRSAQELARLWTEGTGEEQMLSLLGLVDELAGIVVESRAVEKRTYFDDLGRGPRHHDLLVTARGPQGSVVVGVEAKADEPFDLALETYVRRARRRSISTGAPARVDLLTRTLTGRALSSDPSLGTLRYQLFSALAGTLVAARGAAGEGPRAAAAVLLVHEFRTSLTKVEALERNAADLDAFVEAVAPEAPRVASGRNWIAGPFVVEGEHVRWPQGQQTYIAKLTTEIAPGPRA